MTDPRLDQLVGIVGTLLHFGNGSPEGVLAAEGLYYDRVGQALYVKDSGGTSDTGWIAK